MLPGGGLKAAQRFVRCVSSRTHIKQELIVSTAIATFVHYAYRNLRLTTCFVPHVVVNNKRDFYGSARYLER